MKKIIFALSIILSVSAHSQVYNSKCVLGQGGSTGIQARYIKIPNAVNHTIGDSFTYQIWVRPATIFSANEMISSSNITNTLTNLFHVTTKPSGTGTQAGQYLGIDLWNSAGTAIVAHQFSANFRNFFKNGYENKKYLITFTMSKSGSNYVYRSYLNDSLQATTTVSTKPSSFANFTFFQDRSTSGRYGDSYISTTRFYDYCLSASDIKNAYGNGNGAAPLSNPLFNIHFDTIISSGGNFIFPDSSGNNNYAQTVSFVNPLTTCIVPFVNGNEKTKKWIHLEGNSMTGALQGYVGKLRNVELSNWWVYTTEVGGTTTLDMLNRFNGQVKTQVDTSWGQSEMIVWNFHNDSAKGIGVDSSKVLMQMYDDSIATTPYRATYLTTLPSCVLIDTIRTAWNAWLKSTFANVLDICTDTNLGCKLCYLNTTYYADACTHLTQTNTGGNFIVGNAVKSFIQVYGNRFAAPSINNYSISLSSVYPNPSEGVTFIYSELPAQILISDASGREVYKFFKASGDSQVITSEYPTGLYFIKITTYKDSSVYKLLIK